MVVMAMLQCGRPIIGRQQAVLPCPRILRWLISRARWNGFEYSELVFYYFPPSFTLLSFHIAISSSHRLPKDRGILLANLMSFLIYSPALVSLITLLYLLHLILVSNSH